MNNETPLMAAVKLPFEDTAIHLVRKLIAAGGDPNIPDNKGDTPLHVATTKKLVELLLSYKSDVHAKNYLGETPLHLARSSEIARILIEYGADTNASDTSGNSPLHKHVGDVETCKILVHHGARINALNINNRTPLHEALVNNNQETALFLLDSGAEDVSEVSALYLAYVHRCTRRIKDLLWERTKPAHLVFVINFDALKRDEVLKIWSKHTGELMEFLFELVELLENCPLVWWIPSAKLVADFFYGKIAELSPRDCRFFMWRFSKYLGHSVLNFILRTTDYARVSSKDLEELINVLLLHGEILNYSDLEVIFLQKGDCALLHKLLKRVTAEKSRKRKDLPLFLRFLCDVTIDGTILVNRKVCSNVDVVDLYNIHLMARYATLPRKLARQFQQSYNDIVRFKLPELRSKGMEAAIDRLEKTSGVPSLLELARNNTRKVLSKKLGLKSTRDLTVVLENSNLPKIVISILLMEFPLYEAQDADFTAYKKTVQLL